MNIAITNKCNKNCSFCFAREGRKELVDMDFDRIRKFIDLCFSNPDEMIGIFGGEPSKSPYFIDTLEYIFSKEDTYHNHINVMTNLTFDDSICNRIIEIVKCPSRKRRFGILANAEGLENKELRRRYIHNLIKLKSNNISVNPGFTVAPEDNIEEKKNYMKTFLEAISTFKGSLVRLSLCSPVSDNPLTQYNPISNIEYGNKFIEIIKYVLYYNIDFYIDDIIYPCMFKDEDLVGLIENRVKNKCCCSSGIQDVMSNGTIKFCYPLNEEFPYEEGMTLSEIRSRMVSIHNRNLKTWKSCLDCPKYRMGCNGPCNAFIRPKEETPENFDL